jgi:16S rRNA G966 N2-methylase RsmD
MIKFTKNIPLKTLFLYIRYFFRSVYFRGLVKTLRMLVYEGRYEKLFGIETMRIKHSEDEHNFHYQGASYLVLLELFKKLPARLKEKNFIDFGSGKGRALFCAEFLGFNKLTGVELDSELVETANENVKLYTQKRKESSFNFVCENVLDFSIPDNTAVFYFFNPFSEQIMNKVIEAIDRYQLRIKEEIFIIYVNPQFRELWMKAGYSVFHYGGNKRYAEGIIFRKADS